MLNKRRFLAHRMRETGLLRLIEGLGRRPCLLVLAYHRIGDPEATTDYGPVFSATPEGFRRQIEGVQRAFRLLSPAELMATASGAISVGGFSVSQNGNSQIKGFVTVGRIPAGGVVENGEERHPRLEEVAAITVPADRGVELSV